jgi:hypothetical protein
MSAISLSQDEPCNALRKEYDEAFAHWAKQVNLQQSFSEDPAATPAARERVRRQAESAQSIYREKRNRLWECISNSCVECASV